MAMWIDDWQPINARIKALVDTTGLLLSTKVSDQFTPEDYLRDKGGEAVPSSYIRFAAEVLLENVRDTCKSIRSFVQSHASELPAGPRSCLEAFERTLDRLGEPNAHLAGITAAIVSIATFRSQFEYLIADTEAVTKSLAVRAIIHLQSIIVVDEIMRQRWQHAFDDGETGS
jgi:hypothetical protein